MYLRIVTVLLRWLQYLEMSDLAIDVSIVTKCNATDHHKTRSISRTSRSPVISRAPALIVPAYARVN